MAVAVLALPLWACQTPSQTGSPAPSAAEQAAVAAGETCIRREHANYLLGTWAGRWQYNEGGESDTLQITLSRPTRDWADFDVHVRQHLPYGDYGGTTVEYDTGAVIRDCKLVVASAREEERWWSFALNIDRQDPTKASLHGESWFGDRKDKPFAMALDYSSFGARFIWPAR